MTHPKRQDFVAYRSFSDEYEIRFYGSRQRATPTEDTQSK